MHAATKKILRHFQFEHLPSDLAAISGNFHALAWKMAQTLPEDPEVTAGLRHLLEAKDCFVRAAIPDYTESPVRSPEAV